MSASNFLEIYQQYLASVCPKSDLATLSWIEEVGQSTEWDEPQTPLDWNNCGVMALIEAQQASELDVRRLYFELAIAAFANGAKEHPLCAAHLAIAHCLVGNTAEAMQLTISAFVNTLLPVYTATTPSPPGLIYLPRVHFTQTDIGEQLGAIVQIPDGLHQAHRLLCEVICRYLATMFCNDTGLRFLSLAMHILPDSPSNYLSLGIAHQVQSDWEGIVFLHRARQLAPDNFAVMQALYLAYREIEQREVAEFWLKLAQLKESAAQSDRCHWADLPVDSPYTYVPFDDSVWLAVTASLNSIVTAVLLAQGDWFEAEMEFWRNHIQPGMTVIDVGANVGVYSFSAACRVGAAGRVLAIEPFSGCVECLRETCRLNQFNWVQVVAGAASDRPGKANLSLESANELNKLTPEEAEVQGVFETVDCLTLDTLIETEQIGQVDFLKIDAEGHELQVLTGGKHLLAKFKPVILYENLIGSIGANVPVAELLIAQGYHLFSYRPFLQQLIPIDSVENLPGSLNIIALPETKLKDFSMIKNQAA